MHLPRDGMYIISGPVNLFSILKLGTIFFKEEKTNFLSFSFFKYPALKSSGHLRKGLRLFLGPPCSFAPIFLPISLLVFPICVADGVPIRPSGSSSNSSSNFSLRMTRNVAFDRERFHSAKNSWVTRSSFATRPMTPRKTITRSARMEAEVNFD